MQSQILLVEDNELLRNWMLTQLRVQGFQPHAVATAEDAIYFISTQPVDLVMLDINLPGMSGLDLLMQLRKQYSILTLPIIMVTAEEDNKLIVNALKNGANDYLIKPVNPAVANARIRTQLTLRHYASLKEDTIRFASHDLKKPLLVMQDILVELHTELTSSTPNLAESRELTKLVQQTASQMQDVVYGFLQHNARQKMDLLEKFDVTHLIRDVIQANQHYAAQKGIELTSQLQEPMPLITANFFQLRQILDNLLGNALKFSPANTCTRVIAKSDTTSIQVAVQDEGPGLRDEDFSKLFINGARLSNQPTGDESSSGIGLALCKELIQQMSGQIGAENNPHKGTTFWISLPVAPAIASH